MVGFVKDPTGVAALYLGKKEGRDLVYMGKVGIGRAPCPQFGSLNHRGLARRNLPSRHRLDASDYSMLRAEHQTIYDMVT
ncbi:hypothetical protein JOH48_008020 [Bradyrhizobium elkanii]|nr:hypothetical protein [Bradyrhizobium elkanii]